MNNLNTKVDELDLGKLETVPKDLKKLSHVVSKEYAKETVCNKLNKIPDTSALTHDFWNLLKEIYDSIFDEQFNGETLLPIQNLTLKTQSKHYKELFQKKNNPTRKQPNETQILETLTH